MAINNVEHEVNDYLHTLCEKAQHVLEQYEQPSFDLTDLLQKIGNLKLSDIQATIVEKWSSYGWVPILPSFTGADVMANIVPPDTAEKADTRMIRLLTEHELQQLFEALHTYVSASGYNEKTLSEAIDAYKAELYSGCSLLIFALIDSCFITQQPQFSNRRRALAGLSAEKKIKKLDSIILSCADITLNLVQSIFEQAHDFKPEFETGLKRNFISHGMNSYNPSKTDCLKLFVLLHSVYLMFDSEVFEWKQESSQ